MGWNDKVVWSEGMFLKTQHFQQFDRYVERLVRGRVEGLRPHGWGLATYALNRDMMKTGRFALTDAAGVFEDGTPFSLPDGADHPPPLEVAETVRNQIVYLAVPLHQAGAPEFTLDAKAETPARYAAQEFEATDAIHGAPGIARLMVGRLRLRYLLESDDRAGYACIGLARIVEVASDKRILLDERYIPPVLACSASSQLVGFVTEIIGLLHTRGEALAARAAASGTRAGVGQLSDFLLLQLVNRYEPLFAHLNAGNLMHPESFFAEGLQLAGELASFTASGKRPPAFPVYRHDDLQRTFAGLMAELRQSLSAVLEQTAIAIPLQERKYGLRAGIIADKSLLKTATFCLAVKADMPPEVLRRNFPSQVKIGPVEQIRELVNVQLGGIGVRPLPVAPREVPYHAGASYFELDRSSPYFAQLATSGGIALHLAGDFPGVTMELWAIKS
ncbi:MAG: type VI secretion system baseplate subunit TssK [Zavarzinia sp.]|nr:type VI secretion system baseplate subunit TssK [Zavarzinia sp.]